MIYINLKQTYDKIVKIINDYSVSGNLTGESDPNRLDYSLRFRTLIDTAQKEVATVKKIHAVKKISQNPIANQLPSPLYQFDIVQYLGTAQDFTAIGSKAYYFEVDDVATITIDESINGVWTNLVTINHSSLIGQFVAYKGVLNTSVLTNSVRIRFSGSSVYNHRNRALYAYSFSSVDRIPPYTKYNLYQISPNFYQLNKVVQKGQLVNSQSYINTADFYWEKRDTIAINYHNIGEYSVFYYAYPVTIDDSTSELTELEVDIEAQEAIPYHVAAHVLMDEQGKSNVVATLLAIYQNKLSNLDNKIANAPNSVENTLFQPTSNKLF